ncbi:T9SS type A sorting domain-containing protein [bacterium]|nr:T9SS type A sorting domain-containing protein [bacterium]
MTLNAQTEWKDRPIVHKKENQLSPAIARPARLDYTIVVWEDFRNEGDYDIYVQKIDNVTGLPLWMEPDGIAVCTEEGDQRYPRAAYDSLGGVIITWVDERSGYKNVYAQRISATTGEVDANWPSDGAVVCEQDANCEHVRIAGTADGAFITWLDYRDYSSGVNRKVYAQYMLSSTATYPQSTNWVQDGIEVADNIDEGDQANPEIAREYDWDSGKANCVVSFQKYVDVNGDMYWNVYAAKLDATGDKEYGGADIALATNESDQLYPKIVCSGEDVSRDEPRAIVVWQDSREDHSSQPKLYDIYSRTIDADGNIPGNTGDIVCAIDETQQFPVVALWERPYDPLTYDPYIPFVTIAWEDLRDAQQNGVDIYAAVLDARGGSLVNPYGSVGEAIAYATDDEEQPAIDMVPSSSDVFIAWRRHDSSLGADDIHYQEIEVESWYFGKAAGGWPVTEAKNDQNLPQVGGDVIVYEDDRRDVVTNDTRDDWDIYCETPGTCVGPTAMDWRDQFPDVRQSGDADSVRFVTDEEYNTYVVWEKETGVNGNQDVYIQKYDKYGVPRWKHGGIRLNTVSLAGHPGVALSDASGGAQVVWQQKVNGRYQIWYAKIESAGGYDISPELFDAHPRGEYTDPVITYTDYFVDPSGGDGDPAITSDYKAYIGFTYDDNLVIAVKPVSGTVSRTQITLGVDIDDWSNFVKLVSPSGKHLYGVAEGGPTDKRWLSFTARFESAPGGAQTTDFSVYTFKNLIDYGGIDIALDEYETGGSQDAIVLVSYSQDAQYGAMLHAQWLNATNLSASTSPDMIIGVPGSDYRISHPRLAPDDCRAANSYGGMLATWDYEFPVSQVQKHNIQTEKLTYTYGQNPASVSRCDPNAQIIAVTNQSYTWPTNPEIAKVTAPNGIDTLSFIVWEGLTESCSPARGREVVGQWVAYNYFPNPQRGPQWSSELQMSPGAGQYLQTYPLVQTSEDNTVSVYWIDGRASADLVMGTRAWGGAYDAVFWAKEAVADAPVVPNDVILGEAYPNPMSLSAGTPSNVVIQIQSEQTVSLKLYNTFGQVVGSVFDGVLTPGSHTMQFDVSALHSGIYYYVLTASSKTSTRGIVIVR